MEAVVVGAASAAGGFTLGRLAGVEWLGAAVAGAHGVVAGARGIYDWRRPRGWLAAVLDATWGLAGSAGALAVHGIHMFLPDEGGYLEGLSRRRCRHVYAGGLRVRRGYAMAIGNVVTNAAGGLPEIDAGSEQGRRRLRLVERHEDLHVWQNRWFGPLYPAGYLAWLVLGAAWGTLVWILKPRGYGWFGRVDHYAYVRNPFEVWAYRRGRGR